MKKFAQKNWRKMFLEAIFFAFEKTFFRVSVEKFSHCFTRYHWPTKLSANHYPESRFVICTVVTLFALVLHLNCTALSQSESSNFFVCIIMVLTQISRSCFTTISLLNPHIYVLDCFVSLLVIFRYIWEYVKSRDYQGKRVNPWYRP